MVLERRICLFLAVLLLGWSCSRTVSLPLGNVSSMAAAQPDSALSCLEALPRESLSTPRDQAVYDYLYAFCFYRCYYFLEETSQARLSAACRYFTAHGSSMDALQAWELLGAVALSGGQKDLGFYALHQAAVAAQDLTRRQQRAGMLALLLTAILATLILYVWARKSQIRRQLVEASARSDQMMNLAEELQNKLTAALASSSAPADKTFPGLGMLDRLCEQYYVFEGTDHLHPRIVGEVQAIVEGLRSDPRMQKELERALDARYDGLMRRLRAAFPKWKDEDFLLYVFAASGFSSTTIATLMEKDKSIVYNRLYRLKERIRTSGTPYQAQFLSALNG